MNDEISRSDASLHAKYEASGRWLTWWQIGANFIGASIVTSYFVFFDRVFPTSQIQYTFYVVAVMFPVLVVIAHRFFNYWQKDLKRYLLLDMQHREITVNLRNKAQRKILDLPFIASISSFFNWFIASITMTTYSIILESGGTESLTLLLIEGLRVFVGCIIGGLVVAAIIFFITEANCRRIWPYFFPAGGLAKTSGVFRLKLRSRMFVIFILASILPLILMAVLSYNKASLMLTMDPAEVIQSLLYLTAFLLAVTLAVAVILSHLFSIGIIEPVRRMEAAMSRVERGDLKATVTVNSNDELGVLAENFNQMTDGLKDRYRLQRSLDLAKEVQQNLLPREDPVVEGLDVAGQSIYCDETGGDYFDYLSSSEWGQAKFGILIGDVSGHGIPSALLMATARAFMRQRSSLSGSMAEVVSDVNRQLTRDVEETGRFMTLFYLMIDTTAQNMSWVRAGHDPAIWYDPGTDQFEELHGDGIALGVDETHQFVQYQKSGLKEGQILLLSTDGLWETQNPAGSMFGKDRICEIIRQEANTSAREILDAIVLELEHFRQDLEPEDDITLVVIKVAE